MSISLREIFHQFRASKIKGGQKSRDNFHEILRCIVFLENSGLNFLTKSSSDDFLEVRSKTLGDYALQQCYLTIRHFSKFAHLVNSKNDELGYRRRRLKGRRIPIILNEDQVEEIIRGMNATCKGRDLSARTYSTLIGLMYVTGMRVSEALIGLTDHDVNLEENYIYVRPGKSPRDRYIPIPPTTSEMLSRYRDQREHRFPGQTERFFLIHTGAPKDAKSFRNVFNKVTSKLGYRSISQKGYDSRALLPHDLRHTYATNALLRFHRAGLDMASELPKLSMVLGHESPRETYWYTQAVPEILAEMLRKGETV